MLFLRTLAVLSMLFATAAMAADYPPAIKSLVTNRGVEIVSRFNAPGGLTGYAARADGHAVILYTTADGNYAIAGTMFDAKGNILTDAQIDRYLTGPMLKSAWSKLEKSTWVADGAKNPKRIIYEFTDPNCPFCYLFWLANKPYREEGLQVRHILVGVITPNSLYKAAAILEADDPAAAMTRNERDYNSKGDENDAGGVAPLAHPKPSTLAKIKANTALMKSLGVSGTPGVLYRDADGTVHRIVGMPRPSELGKIYRLPPHPVTDPRLKHYD